MELVGGWVGVGVGGSGRDTDGEGGVLALALDGPRLDLGEAATTPRECPASASAKSASDARRLRALAGRRKVRRAAGGDTGDGGSMLPDVRTARSSGDVAAVALGAAVSLRAGVVSRRGAMAGGASAPGVTKGASRGGEASASPNACNNDATSAPA